MKLMYFIEFYFKRNQCNIKQAADRLSISGTLCKSGSTIEKDCTKSKSNWEKWRHVRYVPETWRVLKLLHSSKHSSAHSPKPQHPFLARERKDMTRTHSRSFFPLWHAPQVSEQPSEGNLPARIPKDIFLNPDWYLALQSQEETGLTCTTLLSAPALLRLVRYASHLWDMLTITYIILLQWA